MKHLTLAVSLTLWVNAFVFSNYSVYRDTVEVKKIEGKKGGQNARPRTYGVIQVIQ